jgi:hypothetical protein
MQLFYQYILIIFTIHSLTEGNYIYEVLNFDDGILTIY